jgi:hypothetical protein
MAAGVDISAAGGTPPPPSGGLKPLIAVLDKYQKQLGSVSKAIEDAAESSGATGGNPKAPEVLGPKTQEAINRLDKVLDKVKAAMEARDNASAKESKVISTEAANPTFEGLARAMEATGEANKAANAYADTLKELAKAQEDFKDAQESEKQKPPAPQPAVDMRPNKELDDFFNTPISELKGPPKVENADSRYNPDLDFALGIGPDPKTLIPPTPPTPPAPPIPPVAPAPAPPAPTEPTYLRSPDDFFGPVQPAPSPVAAPSLPPPAAVPVLPQPAPAPPPAPLSAATPVTNPVVTPPPATPVMPALTTGASGPVPVSIVNPLPVPVEGMTAPAPAPAPTAPVKPPEPAEPPKEANPIKGVMGQFGDALSSVGTVLNSVFSSFKAVFSTIGIELKLLAVAAEAVAIVLKPLEQVTQQLSEAIRPVAEALATLVEAAITPMVTALKVVGAVLKVLASPAKLLAGLLKIFGKIVELILSPLKVLESVFTVFGVIVDAVGEVIESLSTPIEMAVDLIVFFGEVWADTIGIIAKLAKSAKNSQTLIFDAFRNVKTTVADLIINPMGAIPELMGRIREAVDTFNPGAMIEFDLAMRDLMAVFGEALLPIIKTVTGVIRKFADTLRPILQALAPAFQKLIDSIGGLLLGNIDKFAKLLERMIPAFEAYLNQVVDAVDRQNAIANQSQAQNSMLDDIGSFFGNFFRTTQQIQESADKTRQQRDSVNLAAMDVVFGHFETLALTTLGSEEAQTADMINRRASGRLYEIDDERKATKAAGKDTPELEASRQNNEMMIKTAAEMRQVREKFVASDKPGKDKAFRLEKGGVVETNLNEALANLNKLKLDQVNPLGSTVTAKQIDDAMDKVTAAQQMAIGDMKTFLQAPDEDKGKGAAQGLAAAQNPAFKSIADLSRDTILKAFTATSSEAQMKEQQNKKAVDNVANLPNIILQGVQAGMKAAMDIQQGVAAAPPAPPALPAPAVAR